MLFFTCSIEHTKLCVKYATRNTNLYIQLELVVRARQLDSVAQLVRAINSLKIAIINSSTVSSIERDAKKSRYL
jgi:hypothetical protein